MNNRTSLLRRYAFNDLIKNKGVNLSLLIIIVLSAFLMATGSMVMERMVGSVDQLFAEAKPPHFLQMHSGAYDKDALQSFAAEHPGIESWTVVQTHGYDGAAITWQRPSTGESGDLSDSLIDNLFVAQNPDFDFLIDQQSRIAQPAPGEVYVPVAYQQQFDLQVGDQLTVRTDEGSPRMSVGGFVRDAQMASSLSSSTRFLVSPTDLRTLGEGGGTSEIIVEYRLSDPAGAGGLQTAYEADEALPKNGQAVTYEMIRIINAFSDGLVGVALIFASLLLITIALLNLRFVIRGTLQDEVRQIGAMKAIGIPNRQISQLYLSKYAVMSLLACVVGGLLAVFATRLLTRNVSMNYAEASVNWLTIVVPLVALLVVYLVVIAICRRVLGAVRRIEVVNALVHGSTLTERQVARQARRGAKHVNRTSLAGHRVGNINRRLGWLDLRSKWRQWVLVPIVFGLAAILIALPMNLLSTFESPRFVTYLGAPQSDVRVDVQYSDDIDTVSAAVLEAMGTDDQLEAVRPYANVLTQVQGAEGAEALRVEVGDFSRGTVDFVRGGAPVAGEIALSVLNAQKYQAEPGDVVRIRTDDTWADHVVSGVYQDVTSGGYTAKMQGQVTRGALGYVIYADVTGGADTNAVVRRYSEQFSSAEVIGMREYVRQTLEYVTSALRGATVLSFVFGIGVALLITCLFLKLRLASDRRSMGVQSAIGFSVREIIAQIRGKTMLAVVVGTIGGLAFTASFGERLIGGLISLAGLGISDLRFIPNPWLVYLATPLALIGTGYLGSVLLTSGLRRTDKSQWLNQ